MDSAYFLFACLISMLLSIPTALADNWQRERNIGKRPITVSTLALGVPGKLSNTDNEDPSWCSSKELLFYDKKLSFDLGDLASKVRRLGLEFDANNLYLTTSEPGSDTALDAWIKDRGGNGIPMFQRWEDRPNTISDCVGFKIHAPRARTDLESILLWYDLPKTLTSTPVGETSTSTGGANNANPNHGQRDPQTTPVGSVPQKRSGPRADLRPDFDATDSEGSEISANCDNCNGKPVRSDQQIRLVLGFQIANDKLKNHKRKSSLTKVEGRVWYRIDGVQDTWRDIGNPKITIDKGSKDTRLQDTVEWKVPSTPGHILQLIACVDTDDAIYEPDESSARKQVQRPEECLTNNRSRIERFYIRYPVDLWASIAIVPDRSFFFPDETVRITVSAHASNDDAGKRQRFPVDKVAAPIWYRVQGRPDAWTPIADIQFSRGKLDKDSKIPETVSWKLPAIPERVLELATCIDSEDAIQELGESVARQLISSPSVSDTRNNCTSRVITVGASVTPAGTSPSEIEGNAGSAANGQQKYRAMDPATRGIIMESF